LWGNIIVGTKVACCCDEQDTRIIRTLDRIKEQLREATAAP
jgi:hypothetical protein